MAHEGQRPDYSSLLIGNGRTLKAASSKIIMAPKARCDSTVSDMAASVALFSKLLSQSSRQVHVQEESHVTVASTRGTTLSSMAKAA